MGWVHSGFNVHVGHPVLADDDEGLEHLARYITRAPMKLDGLTETASSMIVRTPNDPRSGKRDLELDPIELIHRLTQQIPAPRKHLVRYYGWYSNRARGARAARGREVKPELVTTDAATVGPAARCVAMAVKRGASGRGGGKELRGGFVKGRADRTNYPLFE